MKKRMSLKIGVLVASFLLSMVVAWATPPDESSRGDDWNLYDELENDDYDGPRDSGFPNCEADLAECAIELDETEMALEVCEEELAQCQATTATAFPATGQTTCWDSSGVEIPCAGTGHDGDLQAGATLAYTDNSDGTITDDNTGLMWLKQDDNNLGCDAIPGSLDKDCFFEWKDTFGFVDGLNASAFAGYNDWRVANVKELVSILNYGNVFPTISDAFNTGCVPGCTSTTCSCTAATWTWSSTTVPGQPRRAFNVNFSNYDVRSEVKRLAWPVRVVRGGS